MANRVYPKYITAMRKGQVDELTDDIRVMLVKAAQAFDATHEFVSDLTGSNIIQRMAAELTGKSIVDTPGSILDADDFTFPSVVGGESAILVTYNNEGGSDTARRLMYYIDTGSNIPRTTDGDDIPVTWSNATDKISRGD